MTRIRPLYIAAFYVIALAGVCHAWGVATMIGGGTGGAAVTYDLQATFTQEAVGSNSYAFTAASSHYISVADHNDFSFTDGSDNDSAFSAAMWLITPEGGPDTYISKYESAQTEWAIYHDAGEAITFLLKDKTANKNAGMKTANGLSVSSNWRHLAVTYDGNECAVDCDTSMNIYLNGVAVDTTTLFEAGYLGMENLTGEVWIGGGVGYLGGNLTKLIITSDVLSAAEVKSIMRASNCSAYNGLVDNIKACWDLDADTNSDIGSHNGTAQNGVAPDGTPDYPGLSTSSWALMTGQVLTTSFDGVDTGSITLTTNNNLITGNAITVIQNGVLISSDPTDGNMTYQVDVTIPANDAAADCIDIYIRYTDAANHDKVQICDETAGNDLEYISLPGPVTLASADIDWTQSTTYEVKITVSGDSIHQVDVDSVNKINDTTLEASNTAAVGVGVKVLNDPYVFDDFEVPQ